MSSEGLRTLIIAKLKMCHVLQMLIDYKDGEQKYTDYADLEADYLSSKLHPSDLKPAVTTALNKVRRPIGSTVSSVVK